MAKHIWIRGEGGSIFKLDLPLHETIEDRLRKGHIVRVANAKGDSYEGADRGTVNARPPVNASKADWVSWAVVNGAVPDDAEAATKQDLIEKYGLIADSDDEPAEGGEQPPAENTEGQSEETGQEQGGEQPPAE